MSIHAYRAAWNSPDMPPTTRLVLLALADHIGTDGWAWPSHDRLASMCGIDRRTVIRALQQLEKDKVITVQRKKGWTNKYRLTCDTHVTPTSDTHVTRGVTSDAQRCDTRVTRTLRTVNNQAAAAVCPHGTPTSGAAAGCPDCGTHLTLIGQP